MRSSSGRTRANSTYAWPSSRRARVSCADGCGHHHSRRSGRSLSTRRDALVRTSPATRAKSSWSDSGVGGVVEVVRRRGHRLERRPSECSPRTAAASGALVVVLVAGRAGLLAALGRRPSGSRGRSRSCRSPLFREALRRLDARSARPLVPRGARARPARRLRVRDVFAPPSVKNTMTSCTLGRPWIASSCAASSIASE